jgi:hypothetical protein
LLYKYATHSSNVETLSASRKQSAVLHGDEVGEYILFVVIPKEVSSDLELDSDNDLDGCLLLDIIVNGSNGEDNDVQDFVWEDMER